MEKDESKINCSNTIIFNSNEIKISLEKNEYSLVRSQNLYEISILNKGKLDSIREIKNSTISFCVEKSKKTAKGNFIFSSSIPEKCDYFFAENKEKKIVFIRKNIIQLSEVPN